MKALAIGAVVVTGVVLLLAIISTAVVHWVTFTVNHGPVVGDVSTSSGLFRSCSTSNGVSTCVTTPDASVTTELKTVRAMMILGILLSTGALVCGILVLFVMKQMKILYFVAGGIDIAAGLCFMIAMAVFAGDKEDHMDYGACFALCIVSWILAWVAGALFVVSKIMDKE